jgi:hypothetical protein
VIFALATDDRGLTAFPGKLEAIAYCEGVDVRDGGWLFFASDGSPLVPRFAKPQANGFFAVPDDRYVLEGAAEGLYLRDVVGTVTYVEGCGLQSIGDVLRHIAPCR